MQINNERIQKLKNPQIASALVRIMKQAFKGFLQDINIGNSQEIQQYLANHRHHPNQPIQVRDDFSKISHIYLAKKIQSNRHADTISLFFRPKYPNSHGNLAKYKISTLKPHSQVSFIHNKDSVPRNKSEIMIDDAMSYSNMSQNLNIGQNGSNIIDQELPLGQTGRESYLYSVFERSRHGCSVIGSILADHFCRVGLINFKTGVLARAGRTYVNQWNKTVTENDPPYGVMTSTNASSKSNNLVGKQVRQNKIINVIKLFFGKTSDDQPIALSDQELLFHGSYPLDRLINILGNWLDAQQINPMAALINQFGALNINGNDNLTRSLIGEFVRLLSVEYKVYFENQTDISEIKAIDLHEDDIFRTAFGQSNF